MIIQRNILLLLFPAVFITAAPSSLDTFISSFLQDASANTKNSATTIPPLEKTGGEFGEGRIEIKPLTNLKKPKKNTKKRKHLRRKHVELTSGEQLSQSPVVLEKAVVEETAFLQKPRKKKLGKKTRKSYMQHLMEKNADYLKTTTLPPTTTPEPVIYDKVSGVSYNPEDLRQMCRQTRQMANTFGIRDVTAFATGNCALIRLYYPDVTCDQIAVFLQYCESVGSL